MSVCGKPAAFAYEWRPDPWKAVERGSICAVHFDTMMKGARDTGRYVDVMPLLPDSEETCDYDEGAE